MQGRNILLLCFQSESWIIFLLWNPKVVKSGKIDSKKKHKKWSILLSLSLAQKRKNKWV